MDLRLTGKVALVTGASAGIGFAIAQGLAAEGCDLAICGRNLKKLEDACQALMQQFPEVAVTSFCADVHQAVDSQNLVNATLDKFGKIDILINNSEGASSSDILVESLSDDDWRTVFEGKFLGYIRMINLVLPSMKKQQWGRIISIIGTSGKEPAKNLVKSGVANAALINFTKTLATQAASWNVLANVINPGIIDTPRSQQFLEIAALKKGQTINEIKDEFERSIPLGRFGIASEVGNLAVFLASECSSYITGTTIPVDGGLMSSAF